METMMNNILLFHLNWLLAVLFSLALLVWQRSQKKGTKVPWLLIISLLLLLLLGLNLAFYSSVKALIINSLIGIIIFFISRLIFISPDI